MLVIYLLDVIMSKEFENRLDKVDAVLGFIAQNNIKFVEFRFVGIFGNNFRILKPASTVTADIFKEGFTFDGSSIDGWKEINNSDTLAMPDAGSYFVDEFTSDLTIVIFCYILENDGIKLYNRDPRSIAYKAQNYLKSLNVADVAYFGPELEFFVFDNVKTKIDRYKSSFEINSVEFKDKENNTTGYEISDKGGYFAASPSDSMQNIMIDMVNGLEKAGLVVELFHREVASAQAEIGFKYSTLVDSATNCYIYKHVVKNTAFSYGKSATFMPKPIYGDNGSGMHIHQSLWKEGKNLFIGDKECGLSEMALYYIGGIIKHGRALNAFCNPTINSYKRLVPGYEAPVILAYSACNRSASVRIPHITTPNARRVEIRFPDPSCNPFLAMSALLMAGLDGIKNKVHPGSAAVDNLYKIEDKRLYTNVSESLDVALNELDQSREVFTAGDVFTNDFIDTFIQQKKEEIKLMNTVVNPIEFDKYYTC